MLIHLQIIVNSMHRYQPRLHVVESSDIQNLNWENFNTIIFPGTQFTTVTAYQNDKVIALSVKLPFLNYFVSLMKIIIIIIIIFPDNAAKN